MTTLAASDDHALPPADGLPPVDGRPTTDGRLEDLLDAMVGIASDLSLDSVLERIVQVAGRLAGANYAALGVLGVERDRPLSQFITYGLDAEQPALIGDLPRGHGLLGLIIDRPEPLRLSDIASHPASYGFPPQHPPMTSFLGVPVRIGSKVFGNLYLTEKQGGGDFTERDEAVVVALAAAAGVAIENARLYRETERRERWLAATAEITAALLGDVGRHGALQLVADRAREIAEADVAFVVLRGSADDLRIEVVSGPAPSSAMGPTLSMTGTLSGLVVGAGQSVVVDDVAADERVSTDSGVLVGWPDLGPVMMVPLTTAEGVIGLVTLGWMRANAGTFRDIDVHLPGRFAEQTALALQVARGREDAARLALFEDRDRIGRDLHDLVIQRLFAIGLSLDNTSHMSDRPAVVERLTNAVDDIDATIKDIRRSIFTLNSSTSAKDLRTSLHETLGASVSGLGFAPVLTTEGALNALVPPPAVPHLLAVLTEALSNAARHARASRVEVSLVAGDDDVRLMVRDDGSGISGDSVGNGLRNMRERAAALGGECTVTSSPDRGTTVVWRVPIR